MSRSTIAVSASSSGNNTVLAGVAGKRIRVHGYVLVAAGAVSVKWRASTAGDLCGAMPFAANGGASSGDYEDGVWTLPAGESLQLNLSGAVGVYGHVTVSIR